MPRDKVLMVRAMHCWRGAAAVFARERMLEEAQEAIDSEQNLLLAFSAWKMMGFADGLDEEEEERVRAEEEHKAMERLRCCFPPVTQKSKPSTPIMPGF